VAREDRQNLRGAIGSFGGFGEVCRCGPGVPKALPAADYLLAVAAVALDRVNLAGPHSVSWHGAC